MQQAGGGLQSNATFSKFVRSSVGSCKKLKVNETYNALKLRVIAGAIVIALNQLLQVI